MSKSKASAESGRGGDDTGGGAKTAPIGSSNAEEAVLEVENLAALISLAAGDRLEFPRTYVTRNDGEQYESVSRRVFTKKI